MSAQGGVRLEQLVGILCWPGHGLMLWIGHEKFRDSKHAICKLRQQF